MVNYVTLQLVLVADENFASYGQIVILDGLSMQTKILLTSFKTWLPHQKSNSSDDLLAEIQKLNYDSISLFFLRSLSVDIQIASQQVIAEVERIQPNVVMCCGMAEKRERLAIESNAWHKNECLYSTVNLSDLNQKLNVTEISHDAGKFVCEGLYYELLKYLQVESKSIDCIFVHVPKLEGSNVNSILNDISSMFAWFEAKSKQKP